MAHATGGNASPGANAPRDAAAVPADSRNSAAAASHLEREADSAALDQSGKDIAICFLVALAEGLLVLTGINGLLSLPMMLLVHCAIMLGVTLVLDQRERHQMDSRILAVAVVTTAVSGPLGAMLSGLLGVYLRYRKLETELLAAWYDRISGHADADAVVELHERIQAGRTLNPYVDARARFAAILRSGPLEEKQRVLSIITQKYHPRFAELLELALRNQDPPIRVQAAAVVARLKELQRNAVKSLTAQATELAPLANAARLDIATQIAAVLDTGLLDEQDAAASRTLAKSLAQDVLQQSPTDTNAVLMLADMLVRDADDSAAANLLRPLAMQGNGEAVHRLRGCLVRARQFSEAANLPGSSVSMTVGSATPHLELGDAA